MEGSRDSFFHRADLGSSLENAISFDLEELDTVSWFIAPYYFIATLELTIQVQFEKPHTDEAGNRQSKY